MDANTHHADRIGAERRRVMAPALCLLVALLAGEAACGSGEPTPEVFDPIAAAASGGDTTVFDTTENAFGYSARNLPSDEKRRFFVGNSFFRDNWVSAPASTTARDGLGPLFNAQSCSSCHFKDGRSSPFREDGSIGMALLFRFNAPGAPDPVTGQQPFDPVYGEQLQPRAIPGVPGEGTPVVTYEEVTGTFADGTPYTLRKPTYTFDDLAHGPLVEGVMVSPRVSRLITGLGLLEAIPEADLRAQADPDDRDGDGISGRPNMVWDIAAKTTRMGRIGWKADQPSVRQQVAAAFLKDLGITSALLPKQLCTEHQDACNEAPDGVGEDDAEIRAELFDAVVFYSRVLAVPARRDVAEPQVRRGEALFHDTGCASCHVSTWTTGDSDIKALSRQTIHPYTDLLLHDMGEGLADGRPSYLASGREWRTPPLWGVGLVRAVNKHTFFLHDGRARSLEEAILWHGGEALSAREQFRAMSATDREALLAFLGSL